MGLFRSRRQPRRAIWQVALTACSRSPRSATSTSGKRQRALPRSVRRNVGRRRRHHPVRRPHQFRQDPEAEILAEDIRTCTDPGPRRPRQPRLRMRPARKGRRDPPPVGHDRCSTSRRSRSAASALPASRALSAASAAASLRPSASRRSRLSSTIASNEARKLENALRSLRTERTSRSSIMRRSRRPSSASRSRFSSIWARSGWPTPIDRFDHVKAVVHGHAHHGSYEGRTMRGTPVYNVAQFVLRPLFGKPYVVLEI